MALASQSKWALVGPGAIGLYYSALLIKSGVPLSIIARSDLVAMRENGILLRFLQYSGDDAEKLYLNSEFNVTPKQISADSNKVGFVINSHGSPLLLFSRFKVLSCFSN